MSTFIYSDITDDGLALCTGAQAGEVINFTRLIVGDGYMPAGTTPRTIKSVVNLVVSVDITNLQVIGDGTVKVSGAFTSADIGSDFYYRELALMAEGPGGVEIVYSYGNAGNNAELIPMSGGVTLKEKTVSVMTVIGRATNVTAILSSSLFATQEDVDALRGQITAVQQSAAMAQMLAQIGIDGAANAQQTADDALVATQTNAGNILASQNLLANHEMRITRIEDSLLNDISGNPFLITFDSLDGINLIKGVWNTEKERAEC